jgi:hypothetical protein
LLLLFGSPVHDPHRIRFATSLQLDASFLFRLSGQTTGGSAPQTATASSGMRVRTWLAAGSARPPKKQKQKHQKKKAQRATLAAGR